MIPSALGFWPQGEWFYYQDNAPYHTSKDSRTWFHNNGVSLIKPPPYSPDLNPSENMWAYLKRSVDLRFPQDIPGLIHTIETVWDEISEETCSILVDSMHERMQAVINAEGHKTGF